MILSFAFSFPCQFNQLKSNRHVPLRREGESDPVRIHLRESYSGILVEFASAKFLKPPREPDIDFSPSMKVDEFSTIHEVSGVGTPLGFSRVDPGEAQDFGV